MEHSTSRHHEEIITHLRAVQGNIPLHRRESKRKYSFSALPFGEQLAIWDGLWHKADGFYLRLHAYFFLERHLAKASELREMWPVIVHWQNEVNDWPLCDSLSKVYTKILEVMPAEVYAQLQAWNASSDLWKRRQSLVSLLYYSRTKKQYLSFEQVTSLITPLLTDKEYYVQKGLGWALRELHNLYPNQALAYLTQHIKQISAIAFTIAIEKLSVEEKSRLKVQRR